MSTWTVGARLLYTVQVSFATLILLKPSRDRGFAADVGNPGGFCAHTAYCFRIGYTASYQRHDIIIKQGRNDRKLDGNRGGDPSSLLLLPNATGTPRDNHKSQKWNFVSHAFSCYPTLSKKSSGQRRVDANKDERNLGKLTRPAANRESVCVS